MPKFYTSWTVLPHDPIQKLAENLWCVRGIMADGKTDRKMTVARMKDGSLVIHNAIALDDGEMRELEAWGTPRYLVVPNRYHRMDARIYKDRYPDMKVICPAGATKGVSSVVPVDTDYDGAPSDETVRLGHFAGCKQREGWLEVKSGGETTVVINDVVCNVPKAGGPLGFFLAPTGQPSVPRIVRWLVAKDRAALRADLERLASLPGLKRVILSHGTNLDSAEQLRTAAATA